MAKMEEVIEHFSQKFDKLCQARRLDEARGEGQFAFLGNDVITDLAFELADAANSCRNHFVKIMLLQAHLANELEDKVDKDQNITIGLQAFKKTGE